MATDAAGNTATAGPISVTLSNVDTPPAISAVSANPISSGATITWTTNKPANSQVAYGATTAYGSISPLNSSLVTSHSVILTGLSASTTYHYPKCFPGGRTGYDSAATSSDFPTFTTNAPTRCSPATQP